MYRVLRSVSFSLIKFLIVLFSPLQLRKMNKWNTVFLFGFCFLQCSGREPIKARPSSMPFMVYFPSRYRGLCTGTLVARAVVLSAAVCVINPNPDVIDRRPINVVLGTNYRHPRRGIRVQVTKLLIPNLGDSPNWGYLLEKSVTILLLKRKVPDILAEVPTRAIDVDYLGEDILTLQEECVIPGWHFFYKGDTIYPVYKFLLQRNLRVQFMNIAKQNLWCEALTLKFRKGLSNLGFQGEMEHGELICIRDPDKKAQPCHGMYGGPLICKGRVVALMTAPDAQWTNCTGYSNLVHLLSSKFLRPFMTCVSKLFEPEFRVDWELFKDTLYEDIMDIEYDYVPALYDKLFSESSSGSDED